MEYNTIFSAIFAILTIIINIGIIAWYAIAVFDNENRTVHDIIFKTRVVSVN